MRSIPLFVLIALLPACGGVAQFEDVSAEAPFRNLVGKPFVSRTELRIHGITMDPNYAHVVHHYVVTAPPGIVGPEVLSQEVMPPGTRMQAVRVERCVNCPLDARVEVVIRLAGRQSDADAEVRMPYALAQDGSLLSGSR